MAGSHYIPKWMPRYWLAEQLGYPPGVPMIPCGATGTVDGQVYVNPTLRSLKEFRAKTKDMSKLEMIDIGLKALRYWRSKCKCKPPVDGTTSSEEQERARL